MLVILNSDLRERGRWANTFSSLFTSLMAPSLHPLGFNFPFFICLIRLHLCVLVSSHFPISYKLCMCVWLSPCSCVGVESVCVCTYVFVSQSVRLPHHWVCVANELYLIGTSSLPSSHLNDWCTYVHEPLVCRAHAHTIVVQRLMLRSPKPNKQTNSAVFTSSMICLTFESTASVAALPSPIDPF